MALGDIHLDFTWHAVWHNLTSMTPAVDHDYIPGMISATGHAERVRKICGFARKSAEHYFGQRKYGEHAIALIEGSAIKDLSGSNVGKKTIRAWWNSKKASETRRET